MKLPFAQIDAFADRPFTGNPAAVMPLDAWLDDAVLQAIAQENTFPKAPSSLQTRAARPTMNYAGSPRRWRWRHPARS